MAEKTRGFILVKLLRTRNAFTLLEVIIVIIIVGVLASLALPRFFTTIEYAKSIEAMISIGTVRNSIERCYMMRRSYLGPCANFNNLDVENPQDSPNNHFTYAITSNITSYTITATRNSHEGGDGTSLIQLTFDGTTITKSGTGPFGPIQ